MSVTVSLKVRKELVELADKMIKYGIARSRSHAFNIMLERGVSSVKEEVEFWDQVYEKVKEFEKQKYRIRHGGLTKMLEEERSK
jgi:hypothetical protein